MSQWQTLEAQLAALAQERSRPGAVVWGASRLPAAGLLVRGLSQNGRVLTAGLLAFWQTAKQALYGCAAIPPRKRMARGLKLNYPEAVAIIAADIMEAARDGKSVAEAMTLAPTCSRARPSWMACPR